MAINMEEWGANCNHLRTFGTYFCFDCSAPQHLVRFPDPLADGSQAETLSTQRPSSLLLDFMAILDSAVFSENDFFLQNYYLDCTLRRGPQDDFCSYYLLLTQEIIHICLNEYFNPKKAKGAYEITWLKHVIRGLIDGVNSGATHASGNIISIILLNIRLFTRRFCLIKRMSYVYWLWKGLKPKKLIHLHVMIFWQ